MKERYLQMRKASRFDMQFMYDYFIDKGGDRISPQNFVEIMNYLKLKDVINYLDTEFGLTVLQNSKGETIKVI